MNDILDYSEQQLVEPVYLKKSIRLLKICIGIIAIVVVMMGVLVGMASSASRGITTEILLVVVGLLFIAVFVLSSIGLFYSVKSYRRKEGPPRRLIYMFAHAMIFLFMVFLLGLAL